MKQRGHKVFIVDLTSGEPTPYGSEAKRKKETVKANEVLKLDGRINLGLENRYLLDNKQARLLLAEKIRLFKPDVLFSPGLSDAHPDHTAAGRIAEAARFYAKFTRTGLKGQPHYPQYQFYYFCSHLRMVPQISFLVDISKTFREKIKAIRCYRSQFIDNPQNRFIFDYIEKQNRYLGRLIGCEYAEAIFSKEIIKISDLSALL